MRAILVVLVAAIAAAPAVGAASTCDAQPARARRVLVREGAPTSTPSGENVLVGPSADGDFSGQADKWARWNGSAWTFEAPRDCDVAYLRTDWVRRTINDEPVFDSVLFYDGGQWHVLRPGYRFREHALNADTSITIGQLEVEQPVHLRKDDDAINYTWTLPIGAPDAGATLIVSNSGSIAGAITLVVAGDGTINGLSAFKIGADMTFTVSFIANERGTAKWGAH